MPVGNQSDIPYTRVNHNKYMVTDKVAYIGELLCLKKSICCELVNNLPDNAVVPQAPPIGQGTTI